MIIDIKIPSVGESITEAVLAEWFKADGDPVEKDDPLFVIERCETVFGYEKTEAAINHGLEEFFCRNTILFHYGLLALNNNPGVIVFLHIISSHVGRQY